VKKTIAIYSLILVAVLALSFTAIPHVSAQTQNVQILSHSYYIDSLGYLVVVGEVQNTGPNYIQQVILGGTASSSDGTSVDATGQSAYATYLGPNEKAPFYIEFFDQNSENGGIWLGTDVSDISLQVIQAEPTQNYTYRDITVKDDSGRVRQDGAYWVTGNIKNTGTQTATDLIIIGTYYNSAGTVVATGYSNSSRTASLAPQATLPFELGAWDLNQSRVSAEQKIASYKLRVETSAPLLLSANPIITPNPNQTPASPGASTGPTGFLPNSQTDNTTAIIVGVVVAVVIALVVVFLMLRRRKTPTQETADEPKRVQPKKVPKRERR
jgi:hypothetical protein